MADLLGSATTAALIRRSAKRLTDRTAELEELAIGKESFEYRYVVPSSWRDGRDGTIETLRALTQELQPLLVELTGPVVLRRLRSVPELVRCGLFPRESEP